MNYAIEQRLRLIDFLLGHYGYVRREMLMDYYGISIAQASLDLKAYREKRPENTHYDSSQKRWAKSSTFIRLY